MEITPAQCRAARALLNWTQAFLAGASGVSKSTVIGFELQRREVSTSTREAVRRTLEAAGVIFLPENGDGEGVRRRK